MKKLFFLLCLELVMVSFEKDPNLDDLSSQLVSIRTMTRMPHSIRSRLITCRTVSCC